MLQRGRGRKIRLVLQRQKSQVVVGTNHEGERVCGKRVGVGGWFSRVKSRENPPGTTT